MASAPALDHRAVRVVFFGPPNSGKSSLVAAVVANAAGPDAVAIPLTSVEPQPTLRQVLVPHEFAITSVRGPVIVLDCDGQAAGQLLANPDELKRAKARSVLADAVRAAHALVLVVDATAHQLVVEETFRTFDHFLESLEQGREFGREVGGLPVFLTLTKCDKLYRPGDPPTDWLGRVELRRENLAQQFHEWFGTSEPDADPVPFLPFGSLAVHEFATATSVPNDEAFHIYRDPEGTFGVDDLVAELIPEATAYRDRVASARKRLRWTATGAMAVLGTMLLGFMALIASGGFGRNDLLAERVRAYRANEPPPSVRLADRHIARYRRELVAIRESNNFDRLSDDLKVFVTNRLAEFDAYREYRAKFQPPRLGPAEVRSREQVEGLTRDLSESLAPPADRAVAWSETEAVKLREKWQVDLTLLATGEARLHEWYRGLVRRGNQHLLTEQPPDFGWRSAVLATLKDAASPPFDPTAEIAASPTVPVLRGKKLTNAAAFGFDRVDSARRDWLDTRDKLVHLRDLCDALGFTTGPSTPTAVLDLPEPTADGAGSRELAAARLAVLRVSFSAKDYPDDNYPGWQTATFPDPVRGFVAVRLRNIFDTGARHVRRLIAVPSPESAAGWKQVADRIAADDALAAWGKLLRLLRTWSDPGPTADPIRELADFLAKDRFDVSLKTIDVALPDDLFEQRPVPVGHLVFVHTPAVGSPVQLAFRQDGDGKADRPQTVFTFVPVGQAGSLTLRPGDTLTATLPVRAGGRDARLVWSGGRSVVYHFDLTGPPRLDTGEVATGVRLLAPLPTMPVLFPGPR